MDRQVPFEHVLHVVARKCCTWRPLHPRTIVGMAKRLTLRTVTDDGRDSRTPDQADYGRLVGRLILHDATAHICQF
jgi:hypothetical protein